MRNFLLVVVLGLLAVVHSTPVDTTVTQIVPKGEDDVLREAATDGFLVSLPSVITESPQTNMSVHPSQHPETTTQGLQHGPGMGESSIQGEDNNDLTMSSTTQSVSSTHSQQLESTTQAPQRGPDVGESDIEGEGNDGLAMTSTTQSVSSTQNSTPASNQSVVFQTTASAPGSSGFSGFLSESGSGDQENVDDVSAITPSTTQVARQTTSEAPHVRDDVPSVLGENQDLASESASGSGSGIEVEELPLQTARVNFVHASKNDVTDEPMQPGHSTPDWIIIVGFLVGVAALVLLCVAIATRDKWNAPKYAAAPATNTNPSDQQRALEMETFLNNDMPRENGKAAEYTVIPLEELPENYSSH